MDDLQILSSMGRSDPVLEKPEHKLSDASGR